MKLNQQTLILGGLATVAATLFVTRPQLFNSLFPGSAVASTPTQSLPTQPTKPTQPTQPRSQPSDPCQDPLNYPNSTTTNRQPEQIPGSFYGY